MYEKLSTQDCLFVLQETDIQYFKQTLESHEKLVQQSAQYKTNFWEIVLNIFFILEAQKDVYLLDPEKTLLYSSNIYCLNLIENNRSVQSFLKVSPKSPHISYVLAYHLGIQMQQLLIELLEQSEEGKVIKKNIRDGAYYRMHLDESIHDDSIHPFYKEQKVLISILAQSNLTERFHNEVEESLHSTRKYLRVNLSKEWSIVMNR